MVQEAQWLHCCLTFAFCLAMTNVGGLGCRQGWWCASGGGVGGCRDESNLVLWTPTTDWGVALIKGGKRVETWAVCKHHESGGGPGDQWREKIMASVRCDESSMGG